jgi:hypothetical protein
MNHRLSIASVAGAACLFLASTAGTSVAQAPGSGPIDCAWYVRTAVQQQQENQRRGCGFSGPDWTLVASVHASWCQKVTPAEFLTAVRARAARLTSSCGKG